MTARPFIVVLTGSECTGKSTLAAELAHAFDATLSPEFAREYVAGKDAVLDAGDVEPIARGQVAGEDAAVSRAGAVVVKDTDLVSTVVYARHYYGQCPAWIETAAATRRGDLYLLLHPDVPWVADGPFRDRPDSRELLHGLFRSELSSIGAPVVDITGTWDARLARALSAVCGALPADPR
jgi:NadR type nicotinamide-nucleotide adenylyltransferase